MAEWVDEFRAIRIPALHDALQIGESLEIIDRRRTPIVRLWRALAIAILDMLLLGSLTGRVFAAEVTTGAIVGVVTDVDGRPVAGALITAASRSGTYSGKTDARGRFTIVGVAADTYLLTVRATGLKTATDGGVTVLPGQTERVAFQMSAQLQSIGSVRTTHPFALGSTADSFAVSGDAARATSPVASSSGLATYLAGSAQGAIAAVPGVNLDPFANAIVRGGKVDDAVFEYDSVPVPQGLIAEPGGNVVGAQLPTTGLATATVTLAGYEAQSDNALGGVVNLIPAVGTSPATQTLELGTGVGVRYEHVAYTRLWATSDARWRYAFATTLGSEDFAYGDGHTFYPAEAGTYGIALQRRAQASTAANVHYQRDAKDDLSFTLLVGEANYDQYATPYPGETFGAFDGARTSYPGATDPNAAVTFPSRIHGTYDIFKAQWLHTGARALTRVQLYRSQFGSTAGGPFWDDLSFPDGPISLFSQQGGRLQGLGFDVDAVASERHHVRYGAEYRINDTFLDEVVPTADEIVTSHPLLRAALGYAGDTWSPSPSLNVTGAARLSTTRIVPREGSAYTVAAIDPHLALAHRIGADLVARATFDHSTVAPKPLEVERVNSANPAPFVALAPETADTFTYSLEGGGRTQFRATYYSQHEKNRIDVLPANFRTAVAAGQTPNGVGIPTNAGELRAHGVELWVRRGGLTLDANAVRAFSSSASQFAYNSLNAAAVAAGHLFPVGYLPDFTATLSYEIHAGRKLRITPSLSYESGYPYGNGRSVWIFDPVTNGPVQVPNDNHVNPGFNYYFLQDPARPYNATSNPYIGSMGTPEGSDPNTLRTTPRAIVSLHAEHDVTPRLTLVLDVVNLLATAAPIQLQGNPYLIGPPGYLGGNPSYAIAYQRAGGFAAPYVLGNGVPTSDGVNPALPWSYGRDGYVAAAYPAARTIQFRLRYRF